MATSNRNSSDRRQHATKPANASKERDLNDDEIVTDDDVSSFFDEEEESHPGDRRRDPLRR